MASPSALPLDDLRVVELGQLLAGPVLRPAARRLRRRGHQGRGPGHGRPDAPVGPGEAARQVAVVAGRGAQQEVGHLRPAHRRRARTWSAGWSPTADVLSRTSGPAPWSAGAWRPRSCGRSTRGLVLTRVTGFGQTGPYAPRAGFGSIGEAMGGIRYVTGDPTGRRRAPGSRSATRSPPPSPASARSSRCTQRERTGRGQVVDSAIYEAVLAMMESLLPEWAGRRLPARAHRRRAAERRAEQRLPDRRRRDGPHRRQPGHRVPPARRRDGPAGAGRRRAYATHGARGAAHGRARRPDRRRGPRRLDADELLERAARRRRARRRASTAPRTCSPTRTSRPARRSSGSAPRPRRARRCRTSSPKLSATPGAVRTVGPALGEHNDEVYRGLLGLDDDELAALARRPASSETRREGDAHDATGSASTSGGTFTDILLIDEDTGATCRAKTASTPQDQSVGVLRGIEQGVRRRRHRRCPRSAQVLHGTTVATNAILEGKGARVGLVTTHGFRQVLQIARSFVPGGLAGWIIWPKPEPLAALEDTIEVRGADRQRRHGGHRARRGRRPRELRTLAGRRASRPWPSPDQLLRQRRPRGAGRRDRRRGAARRRRSRCRRAVLPELREYERTITTVANAYVQPQVARYVANLARQLPTSGIDGRLSILRSDGGLVSAAVAADNPGQRCCCPARPAASPVRSGSPSRPATRDFLTFDMGGTSTDVALVQDLHAAHRPRDQGRRPHGPGDLGRRPHRRRRRRLDRARPAAHPGAAGRPAVRRRRARARRRTQRAAPSRRSPTPTSCSATCRPRSPAARSPSTATRRARPCRRSPTRRACRVGRGRGRRHHRHRQREHARRRCAWSRCSRASTRATSRSSPSAAPARCTPTRSARLTGSWPVIIPPSPGVLCAYGDATTACATRRSAPSAALRRARPTTSCASILTEPARTTAACTLAARGRRRGRRRRVDLLRSTCATTARASRSPCRSTSTPSTAAAAGSRRCGAAFDAEHERLFSFLLDAEHELVNASAPPSTARGRTSRRRDAGRRRRRPVGRAACARTTICVDGALDRRGRLRPALLRAGNVVTGPGDRHRDGLHHPRAARPRRDRPSQRQPPHPTRRPDATEG